jgi:chemotaxis protein MotB
VLVGGHTDTVPIVGGRLRTNWELSAARAFSVIEFFAGQGLAPERFLARGYGEYRPVAPNDTEQGRRRNRRIEIRLVREVRKT